MRLVKISVTVGKFGQCLMIFCSIDQGSDSRDI